MTCDKDWIKAEIEHAAMCVDEEVNKFKQLFEEPFWILESLASSRPVIQESNSSSSSLSLIL